MSAAPAKSPAVKSNKPKSPAAPSKTLKDAVADVRLAYDQYSHAGFSRGELASVLGVSATSGPFGSRLFTLKEYGLIEGSVDNLKASSLFKRIHASAEGSAEFKKAALEATNRSSVFKTILGNFGQKLPSVDVIASRLEMQHSFNKERAQATAKILRESLDYAGVIDRSGNVLTPRNDGANEEVEEDASETPAGKQREARGEPPPRSALTLEVPLENGRVVKVYYPIDLNENEASKVGKVIAALVG
jgi:hypothetical protein